MKKTFCFSLAAGLLSMPALAAVEADILGSEATLRTGAHALWTLPFETTRYVPARPTATLREAMAAQEEGRFIEAIALLEQDGEAAAATDRELLRASFYLQGNQAGEAGNVLSRLLQRQPQSAEAHALMAMVHLEEGRVDLAHAAVQKAQSLQSSAWVTRIASYVLQAQGRLDEASDMMASLNAQGPADPLNLAREAELALTLGDHPRAAARVLKARRIAPSSPYVMAVAGLVWLVEDDPAQARRAFEIALKRDPEDAKALLGLGLAKARQGELADSLTHLRKAAMVEPSSAVIQTYLGRALYQSGKTAEAQAAYRAAIRLDPQDPAPWIHLAQAQAETGQPGAALASLTEASARKAARAVYRGENLLNEDLQTLQANLAEVYRNLGLNELAWLALSEGAGEKNAVTLKNQAEILQGRRHAENARRSLALQSLFNDALAALPVTLDVYGDGAGQTGASAPQHGAVEGLSGPRASYGDYGALFVAPSRVELDGIVGNRVTWGEQLRAAAAGGRVGVGLAHRYYETQGFSAFHDLANTSWQTTLKWDPQDGTRIFFNYLDFKSVRGEIFYPALFDDTTNITDDSWTGRLGLSQRVGKGGEIRALLSRQRAEQRVEYVLWGGFVQPGSSRADGREIQYRQTNALGLFVAGLQSYQEDAEFPGANANAVEAGRAYVAQKLQLGGHWLMDLGFGRAWQENRDRFSGIYDTQLRRWTPRLGLVYAPSAQTHVRLALRQDIGLREVGGASLAPVETAGMLNQRPADQDRLVRSAGLGFDHRLGAAWLISGEAQMRRTFLPAVDYSTREQYFYEYRRKDARLRLDWLPADRPLAVGLSAGYEKRSNVDDFFELDSIKRQRLIDLKLTGSWFAGPRLTVMAGIGRNRVDGDYLYLGPYNDASTQIDVGLRWKLPQGWLEIGVRNLLDDDFEYSESDPLLPLFTKGRFLYGSARLSW